MKKYICTAQNATWIQQKKRQEVGNDKLRDNDKLRVEWHKYVFSWSSEENNRPNMVLGRMQRIWADDFSETDIVHEL